jgi:hypothetical protein
MDHNIHLSFCISNIEDSNDLSPSIQKFFENYIVYNFIVRLKQEYGYELTNITIEFNKAIHVYAFIEKKQGVNREHLDDLIDMLSKEQQKLQYNGIEYTIKKIKMINKRNINISFIISNSNTNENVNTQTLSHSAQNIFKKYIETVFVPGFKQLDFDLSVYDIKFDVHSIDLIASTYDSNRTSLSAILSMLNEKIIQNIIFSNGQNYVNSRKEQYKFKKVVITEVLPSCPHLFN